MKKNLRTTPARMRLKARRSHIASPQENSTGEKGKPVRSGAEAIFHARLKTSVHRKGKGGKVTKMKETTLRNLERKREKFVEITSKEKKTLHKPTSGKAGMSAMELCDNNDFVTMLILDSYFGSQVHKMNQHFRPFRHKASEWKDIVVQFINHQDYAKAFSSLSTTSAYESFCTNKSSDQLMAVNQHLHRYLKMFDTNAGYTIEKCTRYSKDRYMGCTVRATKNWHKGDTMPLLVGCIAELKTDADKNLIKEDINDFSVMLSSRTERELLMLGPAAFVNHDCQASCEFKAETNDTVCVRAIRDIDAGEELTLFYENNSFGNDNCECECKTCENNASGAFATKRQENKTSCNGLFTTDRNAALILSSRLRMRPKKIYDESFVYRF